MTDKQNDSLEQLAQVRLTREEYDRKLQEYMAVEPTCFGAETADIAYALYEDGEEYDSSKCPVVTGHFLVRGVACYYGRFYSRGPRELIYEISFPAAMEPRGHALALEYEVYRLLEQREVVTLRWFFGHKPFSCPLYWYYSKGTLRRKDGGLELALSRKMHKESYAPSGYEGRPESMVVEDAHINRAAVEEWHEEVRKARERAMFGEE